LTQGVSQLVQVERSLVRLRLRRTVSSGLAGFGVKMIGSPFTTGPGRALAPSTSGLAAVFRRREG
jgi:hypothetical protein